MDKIFDILKRIENQNLEILARLSPKPSRKFLSVEEAAERLDRSPWTVRELCNAGQIKATKDNDGRWRIPADEVSRLEAEGVPRLPKRTSRRDAASPLSLHRKRNARIAVSPLVSHALSTSA
jgi:excisionase family DNA binding protein